MPYSIFCLQTLRELRLDPGRNLQGLISIVYLKVMRKALMKSADMIYLFMALKDLKDVCTANKN